MRMAWRSCLRSLLAKRERAGEPMRMAWRSCLRSFFFPRNHIFIPGIEPIDCGAAFFELAEGFKNDSMAD